MDGRVKPGHDGGVTESVSVWNFAFKPGPSVIREQEIEANACNSGSKELDTDIPAWKNYTFRIHRPNHRAHDKSKQQYPSRPIFSSPHGQPKKGVEDRQKYRQRDNNHNDLE